MASLEQPEYTARLETANEKLEFNLGKSRIITDLTLSDSPGFSGCRSNHHDDQCGV